MDQAKQFLQLLDPNAKKFLFACYDYRKELKGRQFYGSLGIAKPKLKELNEDVYCVYVTVNETDGNSRKKEDIVRARAIWVEDDDVREGPRDDWPLAPSIIVESSPNKYHYYWLTSTTKLDEWDKVMNTMVQDWGCDKNARDVSRVMRLPGYNHRKNLDSPYNCQIIEDNGKVYNWFELKAVFPPSEKKGKTEHSGSGETISDYNEGDAIKALMTSENYHGSLVSISMSLTNKGISRDLQYMTLFGLMHKIPAESRRPEWDARVSDEHLLECIDTAIKKFQDEVQEDDVDVSEIKVRPEEELQESNVEYPPGQLGNLCQEIFEMAPHPNKEIALAAAFGLVSGIIGRSYNVLGMGLNIYIAILADSGIGKAVLKDSINLALRAGGGQFNQGETFVGRSRFTGPKAIFQMLHDGMSRISVLEEAGIMSESQAGDTQGQTRVLLDLYTSCGYGKWAGDEGYSDQKSSVPALHSPALSVVSVSTPLSFLKALKSKKADVSGEVARLWMMRHFGLKPYFNQNRRLDYSKEQISILGKLIAKALPNQRPDEIEVFNLEVDPKYIEKSKAWVDLENRYMVEGDHLRRTLCSRAWAKLMKMAAICSVYNGKNYIGEKEYEWAHRAVEKELGAIHDSFTRDSSDDMAVISRNIVTPAIVKTLTGHFKDKKKNADPKIAKHGIFTYYNLSQILKTNAVLKEIDDDPAKPNPRSGIEKVLWHMVRSGFLTPLNKDKMKEYGSRSTQGYKITNDFKISYMDD